MLKYIVPDKTSVDSYILLINRNLHEQLSQQEQMLLNQFVHSVWDELAAGS